DAAPDFVIEDFKNLASGPPRDHARLGDARIVEYHPTARHGEVQPEEVVQTGLEPPADRVFGYRMASQEDPFRDAADAKFGVRHPEKNQVEEVSRTAEASNPPSK